MTEERGPVTFLMTDIERSSDHWERSESEMAARLEEHDAIIRTIVELLVHYQRRIARALEREGIDVSDREILDPEDAVDAELARLGVSV